MFRLVGDPIDVVTGRVIDDARDFRLIGPLPFEWTRWYDSGRNDVVRSLGHGHAHGYDWRLLFDADGLSVESPAGRRTGFGILRDGENERRGAFTLERRSLRAYRLHRAGEPSIEFAMHALGEAGWPTRFYLPRAEAETPAEPEIRFERGRDGRLAAIVHSTGLRIAVQEDEAGRVLRLDAAWADAEERPLLICGYDDAGNLVAETDAFGRRLTFEWDAANRLVRKTDHRGYSFFFEYDGHGRCTRSAGEDGTLGVALTYNPAEGVTQVTRADGGVWQYFYDAQGRLTRVVQPDGAVILERDDSGRLSGETDALGVTLKHLHDGAGNLVAKVFPSGRMIDPGPGGQTLGQPHYHAAIAAEFDYGRLAPTLPASGATLVTRGGDRLPAADDRPAEPEPHVPPFRCHDWYPPPDHGRRFDVFGRLVSQEGHGGRRRLWAYDPNDSVEQYTDFDGAVHRYEHGSWNKPVRRIDPLGNATRLRWTTQELVAEATDPGGCVSQYAWDRMGRLTGVRRNGVARETYRYDAVGNLIEKRDGDGRSLLRLTPTEDRLVAEIELGSGGGHRFSYDAAGRVLRAETNGVAAEFAYDAFGNRILDQRGGRGVAHRFRGHGNLAASTVLERFSVRCERTENDLAVFPPCGPEIRIERLGGRVFRRRCGGTVVEISRYDEIGRCVLKEIAFDTRRPGSWTRKFRYSGEGDLLEAADSLSGVTRYQYDAAHRLISLHGPGKDGSFRYDAAGNLLAQPELASATCSRRNTIVEADGEAFEYDGRDRVIRRGQVQYEYDSQDMMVACRLPQGMWRAEYDALGRRTKVAWRDREHSFYWDTDRLAAEIDGSGCIRVYIYADALSLTPIAFADYAGVDSDPARGRLCFVFSDQRGAPVLVTDVGGEEVWRAELEPYGRAAIATSSSLVLNLRFPGHYFDELTGLHYNRFRYYDPRLGRYLQSDPLGIAGGVNLHAYPANPLVKVDVRGLMPTSCPCPTCGWMHPPEDCPLRESAFADEDTQNTSLPLIKWDAGVVNHIGNGEPGLDMIIVGTSRGWQPFYRSDGRASGRPGTWFPCDEIFERPAQFRPEGWVNKGRFTEMAGIPENLPDGSPNPLHRFGAEPVGDEEQGVGDEHREISNALRRVTIPPGERRTPEQINDWMDDNDVPPQPFPFNTFRGQDDDDP
jgi:RHS repeat-associated protein